jgi:uncharacterized membrane protein
MANLTAWKFDRPDGASLAVRRLKELENEGLIVLHDAAIVEWPEGEKHPKTRQVGDLTSKWALGGMFWGFLFGLLFFIPVIGGAVGAGIGAIAGSAKSHGIEEDFIKSVKEKVVPGTSALFLRSSSAVVDRVKKEFVGTEMELISTTMSDEDEAALREKFGG